METPEYEGDPCVEDLGRHEDDERGEHSLLDLRVVLRPDVASHGLHHVHPGHLLLLRKSHSVSCQSWDYLILLLISNLLQQSRIVTMSVPDTPGWKHVLLCMKGEGIFGVSCSLFWILLSWYRQGWDEIRHLETDVSLVSRCWLWHIMLSECCLHHLTQITHLWKCFSSRLSWKSCVPNLLLAHTIRLSLSLLALSRSPYESNWLSQLARFFSMYIFI